MPKNIGFYERLGLCLMSIAEDELITAKEEIRLAEIKLKKAKRHCRIAEKIVRRRREKNGKPVNILATATTMVKIEE